MRASVLTLVAPVALLVAYGCEGGGPSAAGLDGRPRTYEGNVSEQFLATTRPNVAVDGGAEISVSFEVRADILGNGQKVLVADATVRYRDAGAGASEDAWSFELVPVRVEIPGATAVCSFTGSDPVVRYLDEDAFLGSQILDTEWVRLAHPDRHEPAPWSIEMRASGGERTLTALSVASSFECLVS